MSFWDHSLVEKLRNQRDEQRFNNENERLAILKAQKDEDDKHIMATRHNFRTLVALNTLGVFAAYPFLRTCTLHQARPDMKIELRKRKIKMSSIFPLKSAIRDQGIRHLYRGVVPTVLMFIPIAYGTGYAQALTSRTMKITSVDEIGSLDEWYRGLAACSILSLFEMIVNPLNIARVKLAADVKNRKFQWGYKYISSIDILARTIRYNGIMGLWTGCTPMILRNFCLFHFNFAAITMLQHDRITMDYEESYYKSHFADVNSAAWGVFFFNCIDSVRTRMQYRLPTHSDDLPAHKYPKMWNVLSPRGTFALFRGGFSAFWASLLMGMWSKYIANIAESVLHPDEESSNLLYRARYATKNRLHHENALAVERYPRRPPDPFPLT